MIRPVDSLAHSIARDVRYAGGRALLVGGCVRDAMLGLVPKDIDMEVFGIPEDRIESLLARVGIVLRTGRSFPVWKVWNDEMGQGDAIDVALPRRETKQGDGHTDFAVTLDPFMTFEEAAYRRDYTLNAMGYDPLTGETLDPFGGKSDLATRTLRHVSHHFAEDPLRVLRGMQFCARFELTAVPDTEVLCRVLSSEHLSKERLWEEWCKLILKGVKPSMGLRFLRAAGWSHHFSELHALHGVPQDPDHHPEGCAWIHSLYCMDAFAETRTGNAREDLIVGFATLCHDMGKATTTTLGEDKRWHAFGHEAAGEEPARAFLGRLTDDKDLIEDVVALVVNHMRPTFLWKEATRGETVKQMNRSVRRLAREVNLERLARLVLIDKSGRPPKPKVSPEADWLRERAAMLDVTTHAPAPILMGRHLIELGVKPGMQMGTIIHAAFEQQIEGNITTLDEAIAFARAELTLQ